MNSISIWEGMYNKCKIDFRDIDLLLITNTKCKLIYVEIVSIEKKLH